MASVFRKKGAGPWLIEYFDQHGRRKRRSSGVTDRRAAERIAAKIEAEVALRKEGVVDARHERFAEESRKPLAQHVQEYIQHCRGRGVAAKSLRDKENQLEWLMAETRASRLGDLTLEAVERVLAAFWKKGRSSRTVNSRRETFRAFGNWCRKTGRTESNLLEFLPKLDETKDRRRIRRPLTDDELARLLEVAEERGRRLWYLTAALAGLRRSELTRLAWGSLDFEQGLLTIRDGKAKREDVVPVHPELLAELEAAKPAGAGPSDRVFPEAVTNLTRKHDFERAGIAPLDDQGRVADLHGLRATLGTRLARAGVAPQIAQRIMRHADYRTTLQHYTVLSLADTAAAVRRLPGGRGKSAATGSGARGTAAGDADCVSSAGGSSGFRTAGAVVSAESVSPSQQNRQQSTHDSARDVTTTCDEESEPSGDDPGPNDRSGRKLREGLRRPARLRSVRGGRRKLLPNPLGNRRSILLSYGRASP